MKRRSPRCKFENHSSFAFYLPRHLFPILAVEGHGGGDLEFGGHLPGAPKIFVSTAELFEIAARRPLFYLTKTPSRLSVPDSLRVLASDDRTTLWTNCVPPSSPAPRGAAPRSLPSTAATPGKQREVMRRLWNLHQPDRERVVREYARMEAAGRVERRSNTYCQTAEQYARRLLYDGLAKGWL